MKNFNILLIATLCTVLALCGCGKKPPVKATALFAGPDDMRITISGHTFTGKLISLKLNPGKYLVKASAPGYSDKYLPLTLKGGNNEIVVDLAKAYGSVLISTEPSGANVTFQGRQVGQTPVVLKDLPCAEYEAQISCHGYADRTVTWKLDNERPQQVHVALEDNIGKVTINSTPSGARVWINDAEVGVTPLVQDVSSGKYLLKLELAGYQSCSESFSISRGQALEISRELKAVPGALVVKSTPDGAMVFLNGTRHGVTPLKIDSLSPGEYSLRVEKDGFDPIERKQNIVSGDNGEVDLRLIASSGQAIIHVRPAGVNVALDGKNVAISEFADDNKYDTKPIVLNKLAPGEHIITLMHPRANPTEKHYKFVIGKDKVINKLYEVWVANCRITYDDGHVEIGTLFAQTPESILFGPRPGIKYQVKRQMIRDVDMLSE